MLVWLGVCIGMKFTVRLHSLWMKNTVLPIDPVPTDRIDPDHKFKKRGIEFLKMSEKQLH